MSLVRPALHVGLPPQERLRPLEPGAMPPHPDLLAKGCHSNQTGGRRHVCSGQAGAAGCGVPAREAAPSCSPDTDGSSTFILTRCIWRGAGEGGQLLFPLPAPLDSPPSPRCSPSPRQAARAPSCPRVSYGLCCPRGNARPLGCSLCPLAPVWAAPSQPAPGTCPRKPSPPSSPLAALSLGLPSGYGRSSSSGAGG